MEKTEIQWIYKRYSDVFQKTTTWIRCTRHVLFIDKTTHVLSTSQSLNPIPCDIPMSTKICKMHEVCLLRLVLVIYKMANFTWTNKRPYLGPRSRHDTLKSTHRTNSPNNYGAHGNIIPSTLCTLIYPGQTSTQHGVVTKTGPKSAKKPKTNPHMLQLFVWCNYSPNRPFLIGKEW